MIGTFRKEDVRRVDSSRTYLPAPRCQGGLGETLAGCARGGAADTPGGAAQPLSTRECARASGRRRREEAQARCSPVCSPAPSASSRGVDGSTTVRPPGRAHSAATRRCPPSSRYVGGLGWERPELRQGPGRAAASARSPVLTWLASSPPKNVSQVQREPLLVLCSRGTSGSLQDQGEGADQDYSGGSGISAGRPEGRGQRT